MKIHVEVSSWFKRYTDNQLSIELELSEGTLAYDAICSAGIPREEIGFVARLPKDKDGSNTIVGECYRVNSGDVLKVYPFIIGG